ncbi:MAG: hypothetical protein LBI29_04105 [Rickettsiales bacterium]|jgi:hypothetical protein|nr:hypothetical protein [Rickettsiales bacterium]
MASGVVRFSRGIGNIYPRDGGGETITTFSIGIGGDFNLSLALTRISSDLEKKKRTSPSSPSSSKGSREGYSGNTVNLGKTEFRKINLKITKNYTKILTGRKSPGQTLKSFIH